MVFCWKSSMSDIGCAGAVFVLKSCAYAIGITVLSFDMGEAIICRWGNVTFSHNLGSVDFSWG